MNSIIFEDLEKIYLNNSFWSDFKDKSVLITGGYGMIASYIVYMYIFLNEYKNLNVQIYVLGRNREKAKKRFGEYINKEYFKFIESELKEKINLKNLDYIIHAASNASSQYYATDPVGTTIPNFLGTFNLLNLSLKSKIKSFLFISSGEVYGKTDKNFIKEEEIGISDPLDIRYCYGESKRMGECLCKCFNYQYGVPTKIIRLGHTYGPTMDINNDRRVFAEFVSNIIKNENIIIKSDGSPMRAFCYLADAVDGIFKVLITGKNGEAYNISNKKGLISMKDLAEKLIKLYPEKNLSIEYRKRSNIDNYIESSIKKHNIPDTSKIEQLKWQCSYSIETGFWRTIESLK